MRRTIAVLTAIAALAAAAPAMAKNDRGRPGTPAAPPGEFHASDSAAMFGGECAPYTGNANRVFHGKVQNCF